MKIRNPFKRNDKPAKAPDLGTLVRGTSLSYDDMARLLRTTPEALAAFEQAYGKAKLEEPKDEHDLFGTNSREAVAMRDEQGLSDKAEALCRHIVDELTAQTSVWSYDGESGACEERYALPDGAGVTREDVMALPREMRPQLTGDLVTKDIAEDSAPALLWFYDAMLKARDKGEADKARDLYHHFRQGLDILDLDPVTYAMIDTNPNSMGHWLPALAEAQRHVPELRIPRTRIARVPLPILQLTRCEYMALTPATMHIVDLWAQRVFRLEADGDYFIKTGTYSSKFDFRNARVHDPKEVAELGQYLLFIHYQALRAASPLCHPCVYGMSTTTEWVVRDFVDDPEGRPTIYNGLPLRTEYRVFIDCDRDEVLGVHAYWDPKVMKRRFDGAKGADSIHDAVTYRAAEPELMADFEANRDRVATLVGNLLPHLDLPGQWSLDVMQSGDTLWLIDMALAENSAFYDETVPRELRAPSEENWLPVLPGGDGKEE